MNILIKYDYGNLYNEYKNNEIHHCYKINKIITKILWINNFLLCVENIHVNI